MSYEYDTHLSHTKFHIRPEGLKMQSNVVHLGLFIVHAK